MLLLLLLLLTQRVRYKEIFLHLSPLLSPSQNPPYSKQERQQVGLTVKVSNDGYRPSLREQWNPAVAVLISQCWAHNPIYRPHLGAVMARIKDIMSKGESTGYVTSLSAPIKAAATEEEPEFGAVDLAPGELWRKVQANTKDVMRGEYIAGGS